MRVRWLRSAASGLTKAMAVCFTMTFEIDDTTRYGRVSSDLKSYWFWGLTPHKRIDMSGQCPAGVAKISEETTFLNGLGTLVTLGIWSPRQSTYYCLRGS